MPQRTKNICGIVRFQEHDIDLFLAEELSVNSEFSRWFVEKSGGGFDCEHPAVRVEINVTEDGSEADVSATYRDSQGRHFRLLVENKITAGKMHEQLERYVRRAMNEHMRGAIERWAVKLFSPAAYWDRHCPDGVQNITFEEAAEFLRHSSASRRAEYRADFLVAASAIRSQQERDQYNAETQPLVKEWWDAVYERLEVRFPGYFIHKTRYPASVYFAPETQDFPRHLLRVDLKGHKGEVDLAFRNCNAQKLSKILKRLPDVPGVLVVNPKSSALRISGLPKFVISDGLAVIDEKVLPAYEAAYRLIEFWKRHSETLREAFED